MTAYLDDNLPSSSSIGKWIRNGVLIVVAIFLAVGLTFPRAIRTCGGGRADQTEAVHNLRQIGLALFEFADAYGKMPDAATAIALRENIAGNLPVDARTSNDFFRQLIATDDCLSEAIFFARIHGIHKPDNVFTGTKALEKGECGFTYFLGATKGCDPRRPLVVTPMIPGTDRFDPAPFKGKVVVLRADNSVISLPIDKYGHVIFEGKNLMDSAHPVWQGKPPSIAWPEL